MRVVVQDANILIDLQTGRVLDAFFCLGWEAHTTDAVLDEVEEPLDEAVRKGQLRVASLSSDQIAAVALLRLQQPRRISFEDCSVLDLADRLQAQLLTGDSNLRICAEQRKIEVRGTLWLLDRMIEEGVLTPRAGTMALGRMMKAGRRLPAAACEERLKRWS